MPRCAVEGATATPGAGLVYPDGGAGAACTARGGTGGGRRGGSGAGTPGNVPLQAASHAACVSASETRRMWPNRLTR